MEFGTPERKLREHRSAPSPDDAPAHKRRRPAGDSGLVVLEGTNPVNVTSEHCQETAGDAEKLKQKPPEVALQEALENLPSGFAEDFFLAQGLAKINSSLAANVTLPVLDAEGIQTEEKPKSERFAAWLELLQRGYSLLVQGVGSKKQLLQDFAEEKLKPAGLIRVHMHAFDARFSLCECFKSLLETIFPKATRTGVSAEALGAAVCAAVVSEQRPICILVHSLELLPRNHIVILSSLAATPGVYFVASVDSIWAPLAWDPRCLKDFEFCREEWDTFVGYEAESTARYPHGLPPWTGLGHDRQRAPKASLSLVLRSLTNNHRELVQAMAKKQLESSNRTGISLSALLRETTEQMIAASVPKLKSLLKELKDHEVIVQRNSSAASAQMLFSLPFTDRVLQRLVQSTDLDSDDEADGVLGEAEDDEYEEEEVVAEVAAEVAEVTAEVAQ